MFEQDDIDINEKNRILKEYLNFLKDERKKIQDKFNFNVPTYILDEIIESKNRNRKENINALINLAKVNDRITAEQAKILKEELVFNNN